MSLGILLAAMGYIFGSTGEDLYKVYSNAGEYLFQIRSSGGFEVDPEYPDIICATTSGSSTGAALYDSTGRLILSADGLLRTGNPGEWIAYNFDAPTHELTLSRVSPSAPAESITVLNTSDFTGEIPRLINGFSLTLAEVDGDLCFVLRGSSSSGGFRVETFSSDGTLLYEGSFPDALMMCLSQSSRNYCVLLQDGRSLVFNLFGETIAGPLGGSLIVQANDYIVFTNTDDSVAVFDPLGAVVYTGHETASSTTPKYFGEGFFPCSDTTGLFGFIDSTGSWAIEPQFDDARPFSSGLAAASVEGKYGYIDITGAFVIQPQFKRAREFRGDFADVASDLRGPLPRDVREYGITRSGELIGTGYYSVIANRYGLFSVTDINNNAYRYSVMNSSGELVVPFSSESYSVQ